MAEPVSIRGDGYGNPYIDALVSPHKWSGTVTYRWVDSDDYTWSDWPSAKGAFVSALNNYAEVCNIKFASDDSDNANMSWFIADNSYPWPDETATAAHQYPEASHINGHFNIDAP